MKKYKFAMPFVRQGFTMIELLIVVALLGILGTVGVTSYTNSLKVGRDAKRKTDLETIRQAMEMYKSDFSTVGYPDAISGSAKTSNCSLYRRLECCLTLSGTGACSVLPYKSNVYISPANFPNDPKNNLNKNDYCYQRLTANTYVLGTILENPPATVDPTCATYDCNTINFGVQPCNYCLSQP